MNPPSALHGAMSRDRKPFTYTPGGLDLSEIKSERMAARLMRNAMNQGVPELPPQHIQSPSMQSTPIAVPNFNCLPVQVFPTFNLPANPKSLLRTRSNPGPRDPPIQRVPPPQPQPSQSQFANNLRETGAAQYDTLNKNTPTYSQINNNRPVSMYEYGTPASTMNYGSDGYTTAFPEANYNTPYFQMPNTNNNVIKSVAPPVELNKGGSNTNNIYKSDLSKDEISLPFTETNKYQERIEDTLKSEFENNKPFLQFLQTNKKENVISEKTHGFENKENTEQFTETIKAEHKLDNKLIPEGGNNDIVEIVMPTVVSTSDPGSIVSKPLEDFSGLNNEKKEVKVVKKQVVKKENDVEEQNGSEEQNGDREVEAVIKLPSKKSAAKTETKVEVTKKTLPDGSIEEVKKTITKTTIDGRTEIKTKTETTIIPKEDDEEEVEEVEEEEEENGEVQEESEKVVEEPSVSVVIKTNEETAKPIENGQENIVKIEERSESTTTTSQKITVVQDSQEEQNEEEEEIVEEEEVEEAEPVTVVLKKTDEKPSQDPEEEVEETQEEEENVETEEIKEQEKSAEVKETALKEDDEEPLIKDEEEVEEEEEYEEAEEKETIENTSESVKETKDKDDSEEQEKEPKDVVEKPTEEEKAPITEESKAEVEDEKQEQKPEVTEEKQEVVVEKEELKNEKQDVSEVILTPKVEKLETPEQKVPLREPSVPLEKVEDVEIKPIGAGDFMTKSHTEIITNVTEKPTGLLTEFNRIENIVTVNRTTKTLDHAYENITQQGIPTVKTYFSPLVDKISTSPLPSRPYQPVYPPQPLSQPTTERRHSLLLERLSVERQMPTEQLYQNNYQYNNQTTEQLRQWSQEPQAEVLTVSNVKPSQITNQQWYQQRDNTIYNNVTPSPQPPTASSWTQPKSQPQAQYQQQSQYQPQPQPQYEAPPPPQVQAQYQSSYTDSIQENSSSNYQNTYSSYAPKPSNWSSNNTSALSPIPTIITPTQPSQYSYLNKDSTESYQKTTQQFSSSSYVPPPWEQDSNYVAPEAPQTYYQPPPQSSTYTPAPNQGWKPTPPASKFSKPPPTAYIPPKPNQSFVKSVTNVEPPKLPGRKTYYSEYERRYISVPESTYVPNETKYQPQPDPSPKYYYDNNEPVETVEPQWRRELREFTEKTQTQTQTETNVKPPWEMDSKYAKAPDATYTPTPTWSQTVRPQSWRERSFESEFMSQEWPKTNTLGRGRPLSSYGKETVPERTRGVSVDRYNPNSYQAPVAAEHPPVQTHTHIAPAPLASGYHNPNVPAYHSRASAEPREQAVSYQQPRQYREARASPFQSRSFKYLQWITGTED